MKKLIAFIGRARSGKDTAAEIIGDRLHQEGQRVSYFAFADTLKDITHSSLNLSREDADTLKISPGVKIVNGLSLREFYNTLGDAIKGYFGADAWNRIVIQDLKEIQSIVDTVICTDMRYPIEERDLREFCETNNIELILIKMKNLNTTQRIDHLDFEEHASEYLTDQIKEDYLIEASSVKEIEEKLEEIFKTKDENAA